MYVFECNKEYNQKLPIKDFSSRFHSISNSNKLNIIIIKNEFDDTTFRYRGYNIIQTMSNNKKFNLNCFLVNELNEIYSILEKIDLVILQRTLWSFEIETFINILKINNIKVIFDIDDLIYSPNYVPKYLNNVSKYDDQDINYFFAYSKRLEFVAEMCDGFIVTTPKLSEYVKNDFNKPVWIFHNYLNLEQERVSQDIVHLKKKSYSKDKFIIGYFSGSSSHKRDLEIVESALLKLLSKYDNIYLKIVGYMDLPSKFNKLREDGRIILSNYVPFEELQYEIGKVDLNIVPLQKHEFNDCKSELKYFEASIVNTLTLATDNIVYKKCINDGFDGFLADEISWFEKMEYIYLNYSKLNHIIDAARIKCLKKYSNKNQEKYLEKLYEDILEYFK